MDLKQISILYLDGLSNRQIGEMLDISRNTVNSYMKLFNACEYNFKELLAMDTVALHKLFTSFTTIDNARFNELMLHFEKVNEGRNHPGFTSCFITMNTRSRLLIRTATPSTWNIINASMPKSKVR